MTMDVMCLHNALEEWREVKTKDQYGEAHLEDLGPTLVMPTSVLNHIMDCSYYFKIGSTADLKKETRWDESDWWGDEVVKMIQRLRLHPPSAVLMTNAPCPLTTTAPHALSNQNAGLALGPGALPSVGEAVPPKVCAKAKCSACGVIGHTSECLLTFTICTMFEN